MGSQSAQWIAMARLVRRTGFGATGPQVDAAVRLGRADYLTRTLASTAADGGVRATPEPTFELIPPLRKGADQAARKQRSQALRDQLVTLTEWWVRRMIAVEQPFPEKLTFCWHNHFATSASKVGYAPLMLAQNTTFRRLGRGDFRRLAQALLIDPAMLDWLDGQKNTVNGANENLAREFMELFTLGHAVAYTEADVKDGARALTGWRFDRFGHTQLVARLHDSKTKTVLGATGNFDQAGFGNAVLAQPGSARHVATRLFRQLVSDTDPGASVVDRLVTAYGSGRDISALLEAMLTDASFAGASNSFVVGPVEWLVGAARALALRPAEGAPTRKLLAVLRALGQLPFYPPNVSGWPSGQAWLSTAAADLRMQAAESLVHAADLSTIEAAARSDRIDAVGYVLGVGRWSPRTVSALLPSIGRPPELVAVALNAPEYLVH